MAAQEILRPSNVSGFLAIAWQMQATDWYDTQPHMISELYADGRQRGTDYVSSWPSRIHVGARYGHSSVRLFGGTKSISTAGIRT